MTRDIFWAHSGAPSQTSKLIWTEFWLENSEWAQKIAHVRRKKKNIQNISSLSHQVQNLLKTFQIAIYSSSVLISPLISDGWDFFKRFWPQVTPTRFPSEKFPPSTSSSWANNRKQKKSNWVSMYLINEVYEDPRVMKNKKAANVKNNSNFNHPYHISPSPRDGSAMPEWNWVNIFLEAGMCPITRWSLVVLRKKIAKARPISLRIGKFSWIFHFLSLLSSSSFTFFAKKKPQNCCLEIGGKFKTKCNFDSDFAPNTRVLEEVSTRFKVWIELSCQDELWVL